MGGAAIKNGELLTLASQQFDVFVTVHRNLAFQQNVDALLIPFVILRAKTSRLSDLQALVPRLLTVLMNVRPGLTEIK
jgi:hypothetical protein